VPVLAERPEESREIHHTIVETVAGARVREEWSVKADLEGWEKPREIDGHVPDVWAEKLGRTLVVEVETCDTIHLDETREQYRAFYGYAKPSPQMNREFRVYTPKECYEEAAEQAEKWGIVSFHVTKHFWYFEDI
jgi:hypothetical protein